MVGLIACYHTWKDWNPKLLVWVDCCGHGSDQTTNHHPLTLLQDSHYTHISADQTSSSEVVGMTMVGLIACSHTWKGWNPKLLVWVDWCGHGSDQTTIHHSLTPLQDSHCTHISADHWLSSEVVGKSLYSHMKGLKSKVIGLRDLFTLPVSCQAIARLPTTDTDTGTSPRLSWVEKSWGVQTLVTIPVL